MAQSVEAGRRRAFELYKASGGMMKEKELANRLKKYNFTVPLLRKIRVSDKWDERLAAEVALPPRRKIVKPTVESPEQPKTTEPAATKTRTKKSTTMVVRNRDKFQRALKLWTDSNGSMTKTSVAHKVGVTQQTLATWMRHPDWILQTAKKQSVRVQASTSEPRPSKPVETTTAAKPIRKRAQFDRARELYQASGGNISNTKIIKELYKEFGTKISPATIAGWKVHPRWEESGSEQPKHVEPEPRPKQLELPVMEPQTLKVERLDTTATALQLLRTIVESNTEALKQIGDLLKK